MVDQTDIQGDVPIINNRPPYSKMLKQGTRLLQSHESSGDGGTRTITTSLFDILKNLDKTMNVDGSSPLSGASTFKGIGNLEPYRSAEVRGGYFPFHEQDIAGTISNNLPQVNATAISDITKIATSHSNDYIRSDAVSALGVIARHRPELVDSAFVKNVTNIAGSDMDIDSDAPIAEVEQGTLAAIVEKRPELINADMVSVMSRTAAKGTLRSNSLDTLKIIAMERPDLVDADMLSAVSKAAALANAAFAKSATKVASTDPDPKERTDALGSIGAIARYQPDLIDADIVSVVSKTAAKTAFDPSVGDKKDLVTRWQHVGDDDAEVLQARDTLRIIAQKRPDLVKQPTYSSPSIVVPEM